MQKVMKILLEKRNNFIVVLRFLLGCFKLCLVLKPDHCAVACIHNTPTVLCVPSKTIILFQLQLVLTYK